MAAEYKGRDKDASQRKPSKPGAKRRDKPKRKQAPGGGKTGIRRPMASLPPTGPPAAPVFGMPPAPPMPGMMPGM